MTLVLLQATLQLQEQFALNHVTSASMLNGLHGCTPSRRKISINIGVMMETLFVKPSSGV
jgi:hypothetical protein